MATSSAVGPASEKIPAGTFRTRQVTCVTVTLRSRAERVDSREALVELVP